MAINLIEKLDNIDLTRIKNFVTMYGAEDYVGNEVYLSDWAKNNIKLYKLLGEKLTVFKKVCITKEYEVLRAEIKDLMYVHDFYSLYSDTLYDILMSNNYGGYYKSITSPTITELIENKFNSNIILDFKNNKKPVKISSGMKLMRVYSKVLDYIDADEKLKNTFENFRIKHSQILNNKNIEGTLCISIHPLDFMTMSDNANGWQSCMSWIDDGCYHTGTIEMMNSNCVVCAYLLPKNEQNNILCFNSEKQEAEYCWNNKKWRQLFYCTKDILLSGKAYPYQCVGLTYQVLDMLKNLARINWNQTYQYGIEKYQDMKHINTLSQMNNNKMFRAKNAKKHNIIIDTKTMYNDLFNDHAIEYWCYRNKVKKNLILNISGPVPCAKCGGHDVVYQLNYDNLSDIESENVEEEDWYDYNMQYSAPKRIICEPCLKDLHCDYCELKDNYNYTHSVAIAREDIITTRKTILSNIMGKKEGHICSSCFRKDLQICPTCNKVFWRNDRLSLIIGLHKNFDKEPDELQRKDLIEHIWRENKINIVKNKIIGFIECPICSDKRLINCVSVDTPWRRKEKGKCPPYDCMKINYYVPRLSDADFAKYNMKNMPNFTLQDFYEYKDGKSIDEIAKKYLKNI